MQLCMTYENNSEIYMPEVKKIIVWGKRFRQLCFTKGTYFWFWAELAIYNRFVVSSVQLKANHLTDLQTDR